MKAIKQFFNVMEFTTLYLFLLFESVDELPKYDYLKESY